MLNIILITLLTSKNDSSNLNPKPREGKETKTKWRHQRTMAQTKTTTKKRSDFDWSNGRKFKFPWITFYKFIVARQRRLLMMVIKMKMICRLCLPQIWTKKAIWWTRYDKADINEDILYTKWINKQSNKGTNEKYIKSSDIFHVKWSCAKIMIVWRFEATE